MGKVWIADHLGLRSQVVVKFLADEYARDADAVSRFSREAAAASQVRSPHVVQMLDYGVALAGHPYIAMELLDGVDLATVLEQRPILALRDAQTILTHVARALVKAHQLGIVHRDIKPENIFLVDAGGGELFAKLLDFGVAKSTLSVGRRTETGMMVGTAFFMSPEQIRGEKSVDHLTDIWALGVVAFEMLTGRLPFMGATVGAVSLAICSDEMPRPSQLNASLGPSVDEWFLKICARDRTQRFQSALDAVEALGQALAARPAATQAIPPPPPIDVSFVRRLTTSAGVSRAVEQPSPAHAELPRWAAPAVVSVVALLGALVGSLGYLVVRPSSPPPSTADPAPTKKTKKAAVADPEPPTQHAEPSSSPAPSQSGASPPSSASSAVPSSAPPVVVGPTPPTASAQAPSAKPSSKPKKPHEEPNIF